MAALVAFIRGKGYNTGMRDLIADALKGYGTPTILKSFVLLRGIGDDQGKLGWIREK